MSSIDACARKAYRTMPTYSDGPFCYVMHSTDDFGRLGCYTWRFGGRTEVTGSLVKPLVNTRPETFHDIFVETKLLRS